MSEWDKDIKFIHFSSIVTVVYSNSIHLKILMSHWRHLTTTFKLPQASYIVLLDDIRIQSNSPPRISASMHQSDFAPYVLGSYNAQWNAPKLPHDKHVSHWSCILWKWRLRNLCWAYGCHCIIEQIREYAIIWHQDWGEFYRHLFWKVPSLVGVLIGIKGGAWSWMCSRWILWPI